MTSGAGAWVRSPCRRAFPSGGAAGVGAASIRTGHCEESVVPAYPGTTAIRGQSAGRRAKLCFTQTVFAEGQANSRATGPESENPLAESVQRGPRAWRSSPPSSHRPCSRRSAVESKRMIPVRVRIRTPSSVRSRRPTDETHTYDPRMEYEPTAASPGPPRPPARGAP